MPGAPTRQAGPARVRFVTLATLLVVLGVARRTRAQSDRADDASVTAPADGAIDRDAAVPPATDAAATDPDAAAPSPPPAPPAPPMPTAPEPVVAIVLEPPLPDEDPWVRTGLAHGTLLDEARARIALQTTLASGTFAEARATLRPVPTGGVALHIAGERRIRVREVAFEGHGGRTLEAVRTDFPVGNAQWASDADVARAVARLEQAYHDAGWARARVRSEWRATDDPDQRVLIVHVREGEPTRVRRIVLAGVPPDVGDAARGAVGFGPGDVADPQAARRAVDPVALELRRAGYLSAHVDAVRFQPVSETRVDAIVPATTGPLYSIEWAGTLLFPRPELNSALHFEDERGLDTTTLAAVVTRVRDFYVRRGFPEAHAHAEILPAFTTPEQRVGRGPIADRSEAWAVCPPSRIAGRCVPDERRAILRFTITPGTRMLVHEAQFPGAVAVHASVLRDILRDYLGSELPGGELLADPRGTVETVLAGTPGFSSARITRARVQLHPEDTYVPELYADAVRRMVARYREEGFLDAAIHAPVVHRVVDSEGRPALDVTFAVTEGPRTLFDEIAFDGNASIASAELVRQTSLRLGVPLSYASLDEARTAMVDHYREHGFLFARIEPVVERSPDQTRALVRFDVHEGPAVRVGQITIRGNERTLRAIIAERIALRRGGLYRTSLVRSTQRQLGELGVFTGVTIAPEDPDVEAPVKDIVIQVVEVLPQALELRGGVSTAEGLRAGFEYAYRNVAGTGITIAARAQVGYQLFFLSGCPAGAGASIDQVYICNYQANYNRLSVGDQLRRRLSLSFIFPAIPLLGPAFRATIDVANQRLIDPQFAIDTTSGALSLTYRPARVFSLTGSGEVQYNVLQLLGADNIQDAIAQDLAFLMAGGASPAALQAEQIRLGRLLLLPQGATTLAAVRLTAQIDARDQIFNPQNGALVSVTGEYVGILNYDPGTSANAAMLPQPGNTLRGIGSVSGYYRLPIGGIVLATNLRAGANFNLEQGRVTYTNRLFFLGGSDSMRGWLQDTFVPEDILHPQPDCDPSVPGATTTGNLNPATALLAQLGGDAFLLWRNEVRVPIGSTNFGVAVFLDAGNLWKGLCHVNPVHLRFDVGFGVRYVTPIGPVAVDIGFNPVPQTLVPADATAMTAAVSEAIAAFNFSIGTF